MRYPSEDQIIWQFNTRNLRTVCHVIEEDFDPADSFEFAEDVEFAAEGGAHWFAAFVSVWYVPDAGQPMLLGHDHLGGCSYRSFDEFVTSHRDADPKNRNTLAMKTKNTVICHYFPSMVTEATSAARERLRELGAVRVREAA